MGLFEYLPADESVGDVFLPGVSDNRKGGLALYCRMDVI